ncbi:uncharacterized protein LOC144449836 [Glandiceps talaboti]
MSNMIRVYLYLLWTTSFLIQEVLLQPTVKYPYNCIDSARRYVATGDRCVYSFLVPRPDDGVCPKVSDAIMELTALREEIGDLQRVNIVQQQEIDNLHDEVDKITAILTNLTREKLEAVTTPTPMMPTNHNITLPPTAPGSTNPETSPTADGTTSTTCTDAHSFNIKDDSYCSQR